MLGNDSWRKDASFHAVTWHRDALVLGSLRTIGTWPLFADPVGMENPLSAGTNPYRPIWM